MVKIVCFIYVTFTKIKNIFKKRYNEKKKDTTGHEGQGTVRRQARRGVGEGTRERRGCRWGLGDHCGSHPSSRCSSPPECDGYETPSVKGCEKAIRAEGLRRAQSGALLRSEFPSTSFTSGAKLVLLLSHVSRVRLCATP